jgi:hypothetical protein
MIKAVSSFDPKSAAGVLARAALSVAYVDHPVVGGEPVELITRVIDEARQQLGLSSEENSQEAFDRIADLLDQEADRLLAPPNTETALFRLAERGDLPSDLYEINIIPNVIDVYSKGFSLEKKIIETTIRAPTQEQHYGPARKPHEPVMISLFLRSFRTKWPLKDFSMIVAAQRNGFRLDVHQAWRVYPRVVNLRGVETPIDWLRKFADHYGYEIDVGGRKGHFFLMAEGPIPNQMSIPQREAKRRGRLEPQASVSRFVQSNPDGTEASALIVAIDIQKYQSTLELLGVREGDFLDRFVRPPVARD